MHSLHGEINRLFNYLIERENTSFSIESIHSKYKWPLDGKEISGLKVICYYFTVVESTWRFLCDVSTQMSRFQTSTLLSVEDNLDFQSDPFGGFSLLMCGSGFNSTSSNTSRSVVKTESLNSNQQNTRAATAENTNTTNTNGSKRRLHKSWGFHGFVVTCPSVKLL